MTSRVLLLTDVVASPERTERLGDAATAALWARHDRIARDLLLVHDGREIDRTDGFLLLFPTVASAVAYALAYHRAIDLLELRARVGVHFGPLTFWENPAADIARGAKPIEVEGLAKPLAARVLALAQGGQTLLTAEARAALGDTRFRVEAHGHWHLKGVNAAVEIFEVGDASAPFVPPPDREKTWRVVRDGDRWMPLNEVRHSLPRERDVFVGRDGDLQELAGRLDDGAALVSVLGIGGSGKTRLVTHYAWTWLGDWPGGAWFCDLSGARDAQGIASAIGRALDVPLGKDDPVVQLGYAIAGHGKCLVILDNFEQVARLAPDTLGQWLDRAREAQFVVTTREVLGLPGETTVALAPLAGADAVALFAARAVQARHDFVLSDAELPDVTALVKLLDGLPLAIELAAARVRMMPPKALLERMSERFKLLASSSGRHTRQATLRATLDWSWDLLSPDERDALAQLSVFAGGFTLDAAEAVLSLGNAGPFDTVLALADKSLVARISDERLDLLVSVQEYAAEKLEARGNRKAAEERHAAHYAQSGTESALDALDRHGGAERLAALGLELDNLIVACRRATARRACAPATATLRAAWALLEYRGPLALAVDLAKGVAAIESQDPLELGWGAFLHGLALALSAPGAEARAQIEVAVHRFREAGAAWCEGRAVAALATMDSYDGRLEEAATGLSAAVASFRAVGDPIGEARALGNFAVVCHYQGRIEEAEAHLLASLAMHRDAGSLRREGIALGNLGGVAERRGRRDEARTRIVAALAIHRAVGNRLFEASALANLGGLCFEAGHPDEARTHLGAALALSRVIGDRRTEGQVLQTVGEMDLSAGRLAEARAGVEAALALQRALGNRLREGMAWRALGELDALEGCPDAGRAHLEAGERLFRAIGAMPDLCMLLCIRAGLEHGDRQSEAARAAFEEALRIAGSIDAGPDSDVGRSLATARVALGVP